MHAKSHFAYRLRRSSEIIFSRLFLEKDLRIAHRKYMEDVISKIAQEKPKAFWSYIKSKKQEFSGVAPLKNKDGFIHSDSSSKVEILNEQFVSAYTREDSSKIPIKGPSSHPSMEPIEVQSKVVHKLLLNLKIHTAAGPDCIPNFILKIAADQMAPTLTKLYQFSLKTDKIPADWKNAFIVPVFKKGKNTYHPIIALCH